MCPFPLQEVTMVCRLKNPFVIIKGATRSSSHLLEEIGIIAGCVIECSATSIHMRPTADYLLASTSQSAYVFHAGHYAKILKLKPYRRAVYKAEQCKAGVRSTGRLLEGTYVIGIYSRSSKLLVDRTSAFE